VLKIVKKQDTFTHFTNICAAGSTILESILESILDNVVNADQTFSQRRFTSQAMLILRLSLKKG